MPAAILVPAMTYPTRTVRLRLSTMMFLQFAVLGTWRVIIARHMGHLGFSGAEMGYVFSTTALGALVSPLAAGWAADRWLPAQVFTGISHLIGAGLLVTAWLQTGFWGLWGTMLAYTVVTLPTLATTNAIVFRHLADTEKFGNIRVWGTVGWIVINVLISAYLRAWETLSPGAARIGDGLLAGAVLSVVLGLFCFSLPDTPPLRRGGNPYEFLKAVRAMADRNFAVVLVVAFAVYTQVPIHYNQALLFLTEQAHGLGMAESSANLILTIGQVAEIAAMLLLAPFVRAWGIRRTVVLGILAWALRYAIFAVVRRPEWIALAQLLHGLCYTFFAVGAMIAVERLSSRDLRASAQGMLVFATTGLGMLIGNLFSGWLYDLFELPDGGHAWAGIFSVPIAVTLLSAVAFVLLFRDPPRTAAAVVVGERAGAESGERSAT